MADPADNDRRPGAFAPTEWSLVLAAAQDKLGGQALNRLCTIYWPAIYGAARRHGLSPEDSEDITQAFFARLLEKKWIEKAQADRGRFRGFLGALLHHFIQNSRRIEGAQKRKGILPDLSLDVERGENMLKTLAPSLDPSQTLDRIWADCLFRTVLEKLEREHAAAGASVLFEAFSPFLSQGAQDGDYKTLERTLGLRRGQAAKHFFKLKQRYLALIRSEIARTLEDPGNVDDELRHLLRAYAG